VKTKLRGVGDNYLWLYICIRGYVGQNASIATMRPRNFNKVAIAITPDL